MLLLVFNIFVGIHMVSMTGTFVYKLEISNDTRYASFNMHVFYCQKLKLDYFLNNNIFGPNNNCTLSFHYYPIKICMFFGILCSKNVNIVNKHFFFSFSQKSFLENLLKLPIYYDVPVKKELNL